MVLINARRYQSINHVQSINTIINTNKQLKFGFKQILCSEVQIPNVLLLKKLSLLFDMGTAETDLYAQYLK